MAFPNLSRGLHTVRLEPVGLVTPVEASVSEKPAIVRTFTNYVRRAAGSFNDLQGAYTFSLEPLVRPRPR